MNVKGKFYTEPKFKFFTLALEMNLPSMWVL